MAVKLNVSASAGGTTAEMRVKFDLHLDNCSYCRAGFCPRAEVLWRNVCLAALRAHRDGAPERLAEEVVAAPVVEQHPATSAALYPSTDSKGGEL